MRDECRERGECVFKNEGEDLARVPADEINSYGSSNGLPIYELHNIKH